MRGVAHAVSDGVRRVLAAPALLAAVTAISLLSPLYPNTASRRVLMEYALVSAFLVGGILDRYARARPTRGYGFFGACGRHFGAMLRLSAVEALLYLAADNLPDLRAALAAAIAVNLVTVYARVRIAVEDRRSAIGALLASWRFIRRNALAAIGVYAPWAAAAVAVAFVARGAAPVLLLPLFASATVLFQSRLAHAGYTAAPPLEWPESPAAEAIANRR
jgi:hypothetical protein